MAKSDIVRWIKSRLLHFICNAVFWPVKSKWHMKESGDTPAPGCAKRFGAASVTGIGRGGLDAKPVLAWTAAGAPLALGIWKTLENAAKIFLRWHRG
jgi:hypothetical protein